MQRFLHCPELILEVVRHADHGTIQSLLRVKAFRGLMQNYMKGILKERHEKYILPPGYGCGGGIWKERREKYGLPPGHSETPGLVGYEYVLASFCNWTHLPMLQPVHEWKSLRILEAREREIEVLLDSPWLRPEPPVGPAGIPWPRLEPGPKAKFRALLKKGLYLCDAIRDMEARAVVKLGCPSKNHAFHPARWPYEEPAAARAFFGRPGMVPDRASEMVEGPMEWKIPKETLKFQRWFLMDASDDELVAIYMLLWIVTESWLEEHIPPAIENGTSNTIPFFMRLIHELLMRHGSWYLYGEITDDAPIRGQRLRQWRQETTVEFKEKMREPGGMYKMLGAVLLYELKKRLDGALELRTKIVAIVEKNIGAERPAFLEPPSDWLWHFSPQ
jgi:hypothetical protein